MFYFVTVCTVKFQWDCISYVVILYSTRPPISIFFCFFVVVFLLYRGSIFSGHAVPLEINFCLCLFAESVITNCCQLYISLIPRFPVLIFTQINS